MSVWSRMRLTATVAAGIVLVTAGQAGAQDQTAEGAQKFLGIIAGQQTTTIALDNTIGWNTVRGMAQECRNVTVEQLFGYKTERQCGNAYPVFVQYPDMVLTKAEAADRCTTVLTFTQPPTMSYGRMGYEFETREVTPDARMTQPLRLEFSKVSKVVQSGRGVYVYAAWGNWRINLPSEDLATRAAYAMEFLRQECDPAAATGF